VTRHSTTFSAADEVSGGLKKENPALGFGAKMKKGSI
jgi:hypothetical protein